MDMQPTYFLFSGRLFHECALAFLTPPAEPAKASAPAWPREDAPPNTPQPRRGEDPSPEGPEGEPVGDDDDEEGDVTSKPVPGPGIPMVPEPGAPDANPIDPRVFLR
jgi:hypothetical protein